MNGNTVKEDDKEYKLHVSFSQQRKDCSVYVTNIPRSSCDQTGLADLFSTYGAVENVSLRQDGTRPSAFINFATSDAAKKAILNAKMLTLPEDAKGPIEVNPHQTRKELSRQEAPAQDKFQDSNLFVRPIPLEVTE